MELFPEQRPSRRYSEIFKKYYADKYADQVKYLGKMADIFLYPNTALSAEASFGVWDKVKSLFVERDIPDYFTFEDIEAEASPFLLNNVSKAYFIDIIRYKEYHYNPEKSNVPYDEYAAEIHGGENQRRLNDEKRAAFLIKWILKAQPIQVLAGEHASITNELLQKQAWYVNEHFAMQILWECLKIKQKNVPKKEIQFLLHQFKYRPYDENIFSLLFGKMKESYS